MIESSSGGLDGAWQMPYMTHRSLHAFSQIETNDIFLQVEHLLIIKNDIDSIAILFTDDD